MCFQIGVPPQVEKLCFIKVNKTFLLQNLRKQFTTGNILSNVHKTSIKKKKRRHFMKHFA